MREWKDIQGYEGYYQVSNDGKIRSLKRVCITKNGQKRKYKRKIMKLLPNSNGYFRVILKTENKAERLFVHRLVALHFCNNPKPKEYNIVNHIDNNPQNNNFNNLEWTTLKGNSQHAKKQGRLKRSEKWKLEHKDLQAKSYTPVEAYDPKTGEVKQRYSFLNECRKDGYQPSSVCCCCKNIRRTHHGLKWRYTNK